MSALRWLRRSTETHQLAMVLVCAGRGQVRDKKKGEDKKERTERKVEQWKKNKRERELGALARAVKRGSCLEPRAGAGHEM